MRHPVHARSVSSLFIASAAAAALVVSCTPASDPQPETPAAPVDVSSEIRAANENFMAAFNAGDAAGVAAMYTENAILYPPNAEPLSGREAITAYFEGAMGAGIVRATLETLEAVGMGDTAVEVGRVTLLGADGTTIDRASYMVMWKRTDGGWNLHRDIFNSDLALTP